MPHRIKSAVTKILKTFLPLVFGLFIFWLIFRQLDFAEIIQILKQDVRFDIIALSLPFGLFANIIRAYRWNLLIQPLGFKPKVSNLIYAVLGNYGVNLVFPRLGEVWRCSMITRYEKVPFTKLFGTLIIDRLADTMMVASIVVVALVMNIGYFEAFFMEHPEYFEKFYGVFTSIWTYAVLLFIVVSIWVAFRFFKNTALIQNTQKMLLNLWEGIRTVFHLERKWLFLLYTLLIWVGYYLYFYICFFAFDFTRDLGWQNGLIAFGMSSVAVAVPVQGSIGPWHAAVIATLMGFGISQINAGAFAFCVHTVQQLIFTAIVGLLGVLALPMTNKGK